MLGDVIVPADPADARIPLDAGYDLPDSIDDQLCWLRDAGFIASVAWTAEDLAVLIADPCA